MTPSSGRIEELFVAASSVRERAYAPYSGFPVGASLVTPSGRIYSGCNVENAAYPVGTCAEAGAIAAMVAGGETRLLAILVVGAGEDPLAPCGACRQRIAEFAEAGAVVHLAGRGGVARTLAIADLLPEAFGPGSLNQPARDGRP